MKSTVTYIFLFVLAVVGGISAQSGCPGCLLDLPDLPEDTIYISETPNATYNSYYESDLGFRLPMTTTPVAGDGVPPGLNISSFEILQVLNVPPGISWEANQTMFQVNDGETDGCVRLCGTPLVIDTFFIEVVMKVNLFISTETSVFIPLVVEPATSSNDGFSITNPSGCGSVTVDFTNNVPSNGLDGYTYNWDFGNGDSSILENPASVTYDSVGVYPINFEANIDTTGYFLTAVTILEAGCNDILGGAPDMKVNVRNPQGEYIYTSDVIDNTNAPVSFTMYLPIGEGTYQIQIIDDDGGLDGADDECGVISFTRNEDGTFSDGDLTIDFTIFHPVETITGTDTVYVYEQPESPTFDDLLAPTICPEDFATLSVSNFTSGLTWFRDSIPLGLPDTQTVYMTNVPGNYLVRYTSPDGCLSEAMAPVFDIYPPLDTVLIETFGNLIQADSSTLLPGSIFSWTLDGVDLDEDRMRFCASESGLYELSVIDPITRCISMSRVLMEVDPNVFCDIVSTREVLVDADWEVYPNPSRGPINIKGELFQGTNLVIQLHDFTGRLLLRQSTFAPKGVWQYALDVPKLPAGVYQLTISNETEAISLPVIRR